MHVEYRIHPSIGIARVGNSSTEFYLAPTSIAGRAIECRKYGDEIFNKDGSHKYVSKYKDAKGGVKRQAAKFRIFKHNADDPKDQGVEVGIGDEITKIEWTVHLANKKAAWWHFEEFVGDLMFGDDNSYENRGAKRRNPKVKGEARKKLIIDPGPRTLNKPRKIVKFNREQVPRNYRFSSFPKKPKRGTQIKSLGEIRTDSKGNLIVLGGFGYAGGNVAIGGFGGADSWYDDISDGPVICRLHTSNGDVITLDAWIIVASPNFAPEIVNITTLDDIMFDVAVRKMNALPQLFDKNEKKKYDDNPNEGWKYGWNPNYRANFKRDIEAIIKRPGGYRWVANVPSMVDFVSPSFDPADASTENEANRKRYFSYWRKPGYINAGFRKERSSNMEHNYGARTKAFSEDVTGKGIPLMPVNSGSNVLTDEFVDKFAALSSTQYQLLKLWAKGQFITEGDDDFAIVHPLDRASVGNCVGIPMCPGIEVSWTVRNPLIYSKPYHIKHRKKDYFKYGLDPMYDETSLGDDADGCEPGDLTKRMAIPWQSDLFECNVDYITFKHKSDKYNRRGKRIPDPPTFVAYWWPPAAPWDVIAGIEDAKEQMAAGGISAGKQVRYSRGIYSHEEMARGWSHLGFILNQNDGPDRSEYPYFVEKERNHKEFGVKGRMHDKTGYPKYFYVDYNPVFYLKRNKRKK